MSETRRTVTIRLQVKDHEAVVKALQNAGAEGEKALKRIESAAKPASGGLLLVNKASQEGKQLVQGYADSLGPVGRVLSAVGPAGIAAAAGIAAVFMGGKALIDMGLLADKANAVSGAFERLSTKSARNAAADLGKLREAVQGTVSDMELMQRTGQALDAGLNFNQTLKALTFLRAYASTFGKDFNELSSTVMTGLIRGSVLRLDDVGINISETDRMFEGLEGNAKKVAVVNEAFRQMDEKMKTIQVTNGTLTESVAKAGVAWENLGISVGQSGGIMKGAVDIWARFLNFSAEALGSDAAEARRWDEEYGRINAKIAKGQQLYPFELDFLEKHKGKISDLAKSYFVLGQAIDITADPDLQKKRQDEAKKAAEEYAARLERLRKQARGQKFEITTGALGGMSQKQLDELYAGVLDYNKIKPKIEMSGATAAEGFLLGYKQYFQTNGTDFDTPTYDMAYTVATNFRERMISLLSESFQDLMAGDFEGAFKNLGLSTVGLIQQGFAEELAKKAVRSKFSVSLSAAIGEATTAAVGGVKTVVGGIFDNAFDQTKLMNIGSTAGGWLKGGVSAGFNWAMPDISRAWASGGTIYTGIQEGAKGALMGAVVGAGIGKLMGDDITAQRTSIAGAIGGVLGSAIPGVGPLLGSTIASALVGVVDKVFFEGARAKAEGRYRDVLTDVQAFGGIQGQGSSSGYFQRIGGFAGIKNDTGAAILEGGYKSEFTDLFRTTLGATKEQAGGMVDVLRQVARVNSGEANDYIVRGISDELGAQIKNIMALAGFSAADIAKISFGTASPGGGGAGSPGAPTIPEIDLGLPVVTTPIVIPPIAPTPAPTPIPGVGVLSFVELAKRTLTQGLADNAYSKRALRGIRTEITQATNEMGGFWPSWSGALLDLASASPSPHSEPFFRSRGVAIGAASGFSGIVNKPTLFVAGENHQPEMVDVIPSGASAAGRTGARMEVHFHIGSLQTLDLEATKRWFAGPAREEVLRMLYNESSMGRGVIFAKGVIG